MEMVDITATKQKEEYEQAEVEADFFQYYGLDTVSDEVEIRDR